MGEVRICGCEWRAGKDGVEYASSAQAVCFAGSGFGIESQQSGFRIGKLRLNVISLEGPAEGFSDGPNYG